MDTKKDKLPVITPENLPSTFRLCDQNAAQAQHYHLRLVMIYILIGLMCASLFQMAFSLTPIRAAKISFLAIVGFAVIIMIVARRWLNNRKWEQTWCRSRAAAEDIRSRSWYYMMGINLTNLAQPDSRPERETRRAFEEAVRTITKNRLEASRLSGDEPEITDDMDQVRCLSISQKISFYLNCRVKDQINWYQKKARTFDHRNRWCKIGSTACEYGALTVALALAFHYYYISVHPSANNLPLTVILSPLLAGAASILAWKQYKRYPELSRMYNQQVKRLNVLEKELTECEQQTDFKVFAHLVKECEDLLTQENQVWFIRRET
jgi:hypothetical protein